MRGTFIALALIFSCATANAQNWDLRYPVCQMLYSPVTMSDCRFETMEQCRASTRGLYAQCMENPYFAGTPDDRKRPRRRHHYQ
jgi:hypothetical protein